MSKLQKQLSSPKELGIWRASSLVVGNMVGSGIFMLPASLAVFGSVSLLGWLLSAAGAICLAIVFAHLSRLIPKAGGPYAYAHSAFGELVGFQVAWSYWVGAWGGNAAITTAFISYISYFFPILDENKGYSFLAALSTVWVFTFINAFSVRMAGTVQLVFTLLKLIPLLLICIFGIFHIDKLNFFPINPSSHSLFEAICASAALTLYAFLGLESATIPAKNISNPEKTIPRATIIGTLLSAAIYIWSTVVLLGIIPASLLAKSHAPFADAGSIIFGSWAGPFIALCAALSALGTLNGWILLQGQMPLAAAQDKLMPHFFAKLSKRGTPVIGLIASSVLLTIALGMNYHSSLVQQFTMLVNLTTFAVLVPYLYSAVADLILVFTQKPQPTQWQLWRAIIISFLGFLYSLLIVIGAGQETVFLGTLWIFLGFPLYAFMKRHKVSA